MNKIIAADFSRLFFFMDLKLDQFKKLLDVNVIGVSNAAYAAICCYDKGSIMVVL